MRHIYLGKNLIKGSNKVKYENVKKNGYDFGPLSLVHIILLQRQFACKSLVLLHKCSNIAT